jgi:hypothetical protein
MGIDEGCDVEKDEISRSAGKIHQRRDKGGVLSYAYSNAGIKLLDIRPYVSSNFRA